MRMGRYGDGKGEEGRMTDERGVGMGVGFQQGVGEGVENGVKSWHFRKLKR